VRAAAVGEEEEEEEEGVPAASSADTGVDEVPACFLALSVTMMMETDERDSSLARSTNRLAPRLLAPTPSDQVGTTHTLGTSRSAPRTVTTSPLSPSSTLIVNESLASVPAVAEVRVAVAMESRVARVSRRLASTAASASATTTTSGGARASLIVVLNTQCSRIASMSVC
jgi:hypothetical protein